MSAIPKLGPIAMRPIERPFYNNRDTQCFEWWFANNESELRRYWKALLDEGDDDVLTAEDFNDFCRVQYECEREQVADWLEDTHEDRWSAYDEDTGIPKRGPI